MKKPYLGAVCLMLIMGLSACNTPFSGPLTFEESYEALISNSSSESVLKTLENFTTTEQTAKIDATYKGEMGGGKLTMDIAAKGHAGSGTFDQKSEGSVSFSGEANMPLEGETPDNVKTDGKIDFKMASGSIYLRVDSLKATSPNTKLSDQIGAGVGIVNGALGGKWIVLDLKKYEDMLGSGAVNAPKIKDLYQLQKTVAELFRKHPFLRNNGEIMEGDTKGYAVSLHNENILTIYSELMKDPTMLELMGSPSEEDKKSMRTELENGIKNIEMNGKLLAGGSDDITLMMTSLKIAGEDAATGTMTRKDDTTSLNLTLISNMPSETGSGVTKNRAVIDIKGTEKEMTGKMDFLENDVLRVSIQGGLTSKFTTNGISISGDVTITGDFVTTGESAKKDEIRIHFEQNTVKIPDFSVSIPEGARTVESIMESFGLGGASEMPPTIDSTEPLNDSEEMDVNLQEEEMLEEYGE